MKYLTLKHSGVSLSRVTCGCWQAGRDYWPGVRDNDSVAALRAAFDAGITSFDTAEDYGAGHSERILAQALGDHRDEIVIASKVSWDHLRRDQLIAACERSLGNLGTDRIDLYQIHWPAGTFGSEHVPLAESMDALLTLKQQGKIRAIGVSNFGRAQLEEACALGPVDSIQPPYSLLWRHIEADIGPYCQRAGVAILAYSSLAQGLLAGRFGRTSELPAGDNRADNRLFQGELYDRVLDTIEALRPIADARGLTMAQLALAWVTAQPGAIAIAGVRTPVQAAENAAAGEVKLSPDELSALDRISREITAHLDDSPVMWTWEV